MEQDWIPDTNEIFAGMSNNIDDANLFRVYNNQKKVYSVRLNQNKEYEIKFGDGIVGKKLDEGDTVFVAYLDTNGEEGNISVQDIQENAKFSIFGKSDESENGFPEELSGLAASERYSDDPEKILETDYQMTFGQDVSKSRPEESVEDIRENAPDWFKTGNRLITRSDYEFWVRNRQTGVIDVKCVNNWEYLATFYRWLYQYGVSGYGDGKHFIQNDLITRYNCKYVDAADANNVYLWVKSESDSSAVQENIKKQCEQLKTLTTEVEVLTPVNVYFDVCAAPKNAVADFSVNQPYVFGDDGEYSPGSYIEVTMDDEITYVNPNL